MRSTAQVQAQQALGKAFVLLMPWQWQHGILIPRGQKTALDYAAGAILRRS